MSTVYDIVIIGGGPAGLSAAITARARNKNVLVISNAAQENPLAASKHVDNYPGMPEATGLHILETMHSQSHNLGVHFLQARAISLIPMQGSAENVDSASKDTPKTRFSVTTSSDYVEAKSVIIACGSSSGGKPILGESEYLGRGVSYCATCDGMLYRNATVLVAGFSSEAAEEANFLAEIGATVHYVAKKVPAILDARIHPHIGKLLAIQGDALGVTHAKIEARLVGSPQGVEPDPQGVGLDSQGVEPDPQGVGLDSQGVEPEQETDGSPQDEPTEKLIEVSGVFILRPGIAPTSMLSSLETKDGYIKTDESMRTNIEGVFAAGDCTGKPLQVAKAVGQGQIAVLSAVEYLS